MNLKKKTLKDVDVEGKAVFVRVDFNVPLKSTGEVADARRIEESLPTILYLVEKKAKVVLASHLGRPKGTRDMKYSLSGVAAKLRELLKKKVAFVTECTEEMISFAVKDAHPGDILMLENVRFYEEEEKNDPAFAKELASCAELFVNDAFGSAHRAHASTEGIAHFLPSCMGFLMEKELTALSSLLEKPQSPFCTLLGGSKVSDKMDMIGNLIPLVDEFLVGGGMAFSFLKAKGVPVGKSLVEEDKLDEAKSILKMMDEKKKQFVLPVDVLVSESPKEEKACRIVPVNDIPENAMGVDIGPRTCETFSGIAKKAKTLFWNGPLGIYEVPAFAKGTEFMARAVAGMSCVSVAGGGDVVAAIDKLGLAKNFTHISTGGGATLEFLEGKELPGVACLSDR